MVKNKQRIGSGGVQGRRNFGDCQLYFQTDMDG